MEYFLLLPSSPHIQLVSVPVFTRTDAVEVTDQDCLSTLFDTRIVVNFSCYPSPRITINFCWPTCIIPKEIKFVVICEKIDVVNQVSQYLIRLLSHIVTVLSFLCWCFIVAKVLKLFLFRSSVDSSSLMQCHYCSQQPYDSGDKFLRWFHPRHHFSPCIHNGKKFRNLHSYKTMAIWATKTNLVGVDILQFLYLRIIWHPFVLPDSGKVCVTQWQHNMIKKTYLYLW